MCGEINGNIENYPGYKTRFPHRNNGYATEAARAVLGWGLDSIGLKRIVANMAFDNKASAMAAEKTGVKN